MESGKFSKIDLKSLPEPGSRYKLGMKVGGGVGGEVFEAADTQTGRKVAVKVVDLRRDAEADVRRECCLLREMSKSENFPKFHDAYLKKGKDVEKIWLVMEFCEGGTATDLVRKLEQQNKKMKELHIAYIMRETIKAVVRLHERDVAHRDVRGSNVLLTAEGRVKLADFGISRPLDKDRKMKTCVGSPGWLAPEVISSRAEEETDGYDKKADVWALGITAVELGDGHAPFEDMHPGRTLSQIVQNPPPTLRKPSDWSQIYNDFVSECLVKNPENRPHVQELLQHPFFEPIDAEENLLADLKDILESQKNINLYQKPDVQVRQGFMKVEQQSTPEKILQEDLTSLTEVSEDSVLGELHDRLKRNEFQTFLGDVLLILNPNTRPDVYGEKHHQKYRFKGKSQNAPHIYSVAESAYRDVFHHGKPQHILFAGETGTGKTINMMHATDHLLFLGQGLKSSEKVSKALNVIHAMGNASTPHNADSTRHVLQSQLTFTDTGKVSGAVFRMYQLEKERVIATAKKQATFHLFYYFYDAIKSENRLAEFKLNEENNYEFLKADRGRESAPEENVSQYRLFETDLRDLEFESDQIDSIRNILSAIMVAGEIEFDDDEDGNGLLTTPEVVAKVAELLGVDEKKLSWALLNYCVILKGQAAMRRNSKEEASAAKSELARGLYSRLVDWIVNTINEKFSVPRFIYGDKHVISLLDFYGFECYKRNTLNQLFVNAMNEQLQFHYNQVIFAWDKQIAEEEGEEIPFPSLDFNDNKVVVDLIMSKPDGLLHKIDEATRNEDSFDLIESLSADRTGPIYAETSREFSINHYTGKLTYDGRDMPKKNQDFLPPEIIDTMRLSTRELTKQLFSSLLSKSGNLSTQSNNHGRRLGDENATAAEKRKKENQVNTNLQGQYSQSRQMRTAASTFRSTCIDILKNLTKRESGFHFVRCIRTDLSNKRGGFDPEVVRQQLRALAVVTTLLKIQQGYSYSVSHGDFIRRYKFLAFDFDENVEETKENCRLLLLRLKLEGWFMGQKRVFLKSYNKEYLSRLYETQIRKIVKVQSMMRAFITRRKLYAKIRRYQLNADRNKFLTEADVDRVEESPEATVDQKSDLTETQKTFIMPWFKRWRAKSIFQVLLLYRAERLQAIVNFCLQIHIYNQDALSIVRKANGEVKLDELNREAEPTDYLPPAKISAPKLPFMWESLNLRGDVTNCEPLPRFDIDTLESEIKTNLDKEDSELSDGHHQEISTASDRGPKEDTIIENEERQLELSSNFKKQEEELNSDADDHTMVNTPPLVPSVNNDSPQVTVDQTEETNNRRRHSTSQEAELNENPINLINESGEVNNQRQNSLEPDQNWKLQENVMEESMKEDFVQEYSINEEKKASKEENCKNRTKSPSCHSLKSQNNSQRQIIPQQKFGTSINELQEKFRNTDCNESGDDPPFNFRAILRKTNFSTGSDKMSSEISLFERDKNNFFTTEKREYRNIGIVNKKRRHSDMVITEIAPGILVYGKIADL